MAMTKRRPDSAEITLSARSGHREVRRRETIISWLLDNGVVLVLLGLIAYFSFASPYFLSVNNLLNIGIAVAINGILAAGMTIALIAGQLDLTVGSVIGLTTVIVAELQVNHGISFAIAILIAVVAAVAVGFLNGILVVNLGINSIIATLAVGVVVDAFALLLANGQTIPLTNVSLTNAVTARLAGVPVTVILLAAIYVTCYVLLMRTQLGWHIYASGGNPSAAERAGIRVGTLWRLVFVISAVGAAIGGIITVGQAASGQAEYATGIQFDVLTAILLGGIGLAGGSGRIERTLVGVLIIGVLNNGLVLLNVGSYYQQVAQGIIFVGAVVLGALQQKRSRR